MAERGTDPPIGRMGEKSCPIREFTADNISVGRCWSYLEDGKTCTRHGDVSAAVAEYKATGKLTDEPGYGKDRRTT